MTSKGLRIHLAGGTPPSTPTAVRSRNVSLTKDSHRATVGLPTPRSSIEEARISDDTSPPRLQILEYDHAAEDYAIDPSRPLGHGLWSNVYLATPTAKVLNATADLTPPPSPLTATFHAPPPPVTASSMAGKYAIKQPASRPARAVLRAEAIVLTCLSRLPAAAASRFVPFHGLDPRTGALVLGACPFSLEGFVAEHLSGDDPSEAERVGQLSRCWPRVAVGLARALEEMERAGVVHADVKPGNVLLRPAVGGVADADAGPYDAVLADFSSARLLAAGSPTQGNPAASQPLGGGTWDFLAPSLARGPRAEPTPSTDLYAAAATLLFLALGRSPFEGAANVWQRREMVRQGRALAFAVEVGEDAAGGRRRLEGLEREWKGAVAWLERGLVGDDGGRVGAAEWRAEAERLFGGQ